MMSDQQKHADAVHKRLMGKQPEPRRTMKIDRQSKPVEISIEEIQEPPRKPVLLLNDDPSWRDGVRRILMTYGETMARLTGDARDTDAVQCRREIVKFLSETGWGNSRIGRFINRDHTTVYNLLKPELRRDVRNARLTRQ